MVSSQLATRRALRRWAFVFVAASLAWLALTVRDDPTRRMFCGLWRTRDVIAAVTLAYLALLLLAAAASRRAAFAVATATLMTCASIGVLELLGFVGVVNYPQVFQRATSDVVGMQAVPHQNLTGQTYQDLAVRYGLPTEPIDYHYVTDRRGYRNPQDLAAAELYLVGDSILVAGLLPIEQTVTSRLAASLGVPTMNVALIGLSPQAERDRFLAAQLPLEHRLVLQFVFEGNDLLDSAGYRRPEQQRPSLLESTLCHGLAVWIQRRTDGRRLAEERQFGQIGTEKYWFYWTERAFRGVEDEFPYICDALVDMRQNVESARGQYAVVYVPAKIRVLGPSCSWPVDSSITDYRMLLSPLREWLTTWCREQGIALLDLSDPLGDSAARGEIPWFPADTHPNAVGHHVMADAISAWDVVRTWHSRRAALP